MAWATMGRRILPLTRARSGITARYRALRLRLAVALACLALLLQSAALLVHHTLAPHHHQLAAMAPDVAHHEHGKQDHGKAPKSCPVWAALQHIGSGLAGFAPPILLLAFIPVALSGVAPPMPAHPRLRGAAQPRAPPTPI
jgi:hypothetical protein